MKTNNLNIVLFQPEIPENTGNISRTCVGFKATLHMIRPYGFILDNKRMKRAGLDYWDNLEMIQYDNWDNFKEKNNINNESKNIFLITKFAKKSLDELELTKTYDQIFFVFGRETKGLPKEIMEEFFENQIKIKMNKNIRSFNLSNTVAMVSHHYHFLTKFKNI